MGAESGFPFVALSDMDQVVCVTEVDFHIESCLLWAVKEVRDAGQGVVVLLHDLIQTAEVNAEAECSILLAYEQNQSSTW